MSKVHRNDPCPCGSGKKYKQCCLPKARDLANERAANRELVQEAVNWLSQQHGDALARWVEEVWFADVSEDERKGIATADAAIKSVHDTNLLEYLIAEGEFAPEEDAGEEKEQSDAMRVLQLVLDSAEHLLPSQQAYLEQLGERPLHLYKVSESQPGIGFTLTRFPEGDGETVEIEDKWISRMLDIGDVVGLRPMRTAGVWETSGAVYFIPEDYVDALIGRLEEAGDAAYSRTLIRYWLGLVAAHV